MILRVIKKLLPKELKSLIIESILIAVILTLIGLDWAEVLKFILKLFNLDEPNWLIK